MPNYTTHFVSAVDYCSFLFPYLFFSLRLSLHVVDFSLLPHYLPAVTDRSSQIHSTVLAFSYSPSILSVILFFFPVPIFHINFTFLSLPINFGDPRSSSQFLFDLQFLLFRSFSPCLSCPCHSHSLQFLYSSLNTAFMA